MYHKVISYYTLSEGSVHYYKFVLDRATCTLRKKGWIDVEFPYILRFWHFSHRREIPLTFWGQWNAIYISQQRCESETMTNMLKCSIIMLFLTSNVDFESSFDSLNQCFPLALWKSQVFEFRPFHQAKQKFSCWLKLLMITQNNACQPYVTIDLHDNWNSNYQTITSPIFWNLNLLIYHSGKKQLNGSGEYLRTHSPKFIPIRNAL